MASNPYINKVEYAGQTLMDITGDTVVPSDVLNGKSFHDRSGAPQTGNLITHDVYDGLDSTSSSDALSAKQGKVLNEKITLIEQPSSMPNSVYLARVGKIGMISFEASTAFEKTANELLFTVPSGYRPSTYLSFVEPLRKARVSMYPNGSVYCSMTTKDNVIRGAITYIIGE